MFNPFTDVDKCYIYFIWSQVTLMSTSHHTTWGRYLCFKWHKMSSKVVMQLLNNLFLKEYLLIQFSYIQEIASKFESNSTSTRIICDTTDVTRSYVKKVEYVIKKENKILFYNITHCIDGNYANCNHHYYLNKLLL